MTTEEPASRNATEGMMEVMEPGALTPNGFDEFLQTGRTGRRNAIPDNILNNDGSTTSTADLPCEMQKLSCTDASSDGSQPSTSGTQETDPSSSPEETTQELGS